ncbi:MAG: hypothetical protein OEM29_03275 [Thermoplasmata archaeon]|nr:hypothetical protein [Thermoplasmata archaeon]
MSVYNVGNESVDASVDQADRIKRERLQRELMTSSFFNLSGGFLKEEKHSSWSSIDDLLCKLMAQSPERRFTKHVDRNLDYLHTSLQLDMIRMVAEDIKPEKREHNFARDRAVQSLRGTGEMPEPSPATD